MFKKLRTIIYRTSDLQKAKKWYTKITGVSPYFDEPFYVGFNINDYELGLDPDLNNISNGERSVAYWLVDNIKEAVNKLIANDAKIISPINKVGEGIWVAVVEDPFGNYIGLIEENL